jgi:SNF2 family DNA or RNA helicase
MPTDPAPPRQLVIYLHHDVDTNRIFVSTGGSKDERFRLLPGSRWLPTRKIWSIVGTAGVAQRVVEACGVDRTDPTKSFVRLLNKNSSIEEAEAVRDAKALPQPPIRRLKSWTHQKQAYHFSLPLPAVMLAMGMGTGKTKVTFDVIQNSPQIQRVLIACPKAALEDVWESQFPEHWASDDGTSILILRDGSQLERANRAYDYLTSEDAGRRIIAVNYEILWQPTFGDMAISGDWDLIVLDESHRIRSAGGRTSRYLFRLGERAAKRMCLSGTPLANGPRDVYGQYRFLDAGVFGTNIQRFDEEFVLRGGYGGFQIVGYKNQDEFNRRFYSIAYRVTDEVLDLPPLHQIERKTSFTPAMRKLYDKFDKEFTAEIEDDSLTADNVLVKGIRQFQMTSGYVKTDSGKLRQIDTAKQDLFADVLLDLDVREPIVIFAQFHPDLDRIRQISEKSGRTVGELSGRSNDLAAWKRGDYDILAVQIQAGSESIDLTRARYAIYWSLGYDYILYHQSLKRLWRTHKSKRAVTLIHLLVRGTIDVDAMSTIRKKGRLIETILARRNHG